MGAKFLEAIRFPPLAGDLAVTVTENIEVAMANFDASSPLTVDQPYPSEPRGKKYCDVWVTATQLLPKHEVKPELEINEFKSPIGDESKIRQEVFDAISLHKVTTDFYILAKVDNNEIVEYRYTYFKNCKWVSDGSAKPNKSFNTDTSDAGAG